MMLGVVGCNFEKMSFAALKALQHAGFRHSDAVKPDIEHRQRKRLDNRLTETVCAVLGMEDVDVQWR